MFTIAERVQNGIDLLDAKKPGWRELIDVDSLDLNNKCDCILGQQDWPVSTSIYDAFECGMISLELGLIQAENLGFYVLDALNLGVLPLEDYDDGECEPTEVCVYRLLTDEWKRRLREFQVDVKGLENNG